VADAVSALINLGYGQPQAAAAIAAATRNAGEGARTEQLIRLGLKELAK
jgi:Holliday junction DNA helicase RuvA